MKLLFFICLQIVSSFSFGQIVRGQVVTKGKYREALPGVNIMEKGKSIGTTTDLEGFFSLRVRSLDTSSLVVSFVGFNTQEIHLHGRTEILVKLGGCNKDFFDSRSATIYVSTGLANTPLGGQIQVSTPWTPVGLFKAKFNYQTNSAEHEYINPQLDLMHVLVTCEYDLDLELSLRKLKSNHNLEARTISIESINNFDHFVIVAGYGQSEIESDLRPSSNHTSGPVLGIGKFIGKPIYGKLIGRVTVLKNDIEYRGIIQSRRRRFSSYIKFYKLGSFNEISLGIGYSFRY